MRPSTRHHDSHHDLRDSCLLVTGTVVITITKLRTSARSSGRRKSVQQKRHTNSEDL